MQACNSLKRTITKILDAALKNTTIALEEEHNPNNTYEVQFKTRESHKIAPLKS
jgi:hypothetical protein